MKKYRDSEENFEAGLLPMFEWMDNEDVGEPSQEILEGKVDKSDRTKGWRTRRFGNAMKSMMQDGIHAASHVNGGFDWVSLGKATVVDVCGSFGHISVEIAAKAPDLTIVVQDFPTIKPGFDSTVPENLKSRISFQPYNFFEPQPTQGAAVYFFKHIFHDWSDNKNVEILSNTVSTMKPGSRIVIMDSIMPEIGEGPIVVNKMMTSFDLQMMTLFNAKERTEAEWVGLMKSADERLVVKAFRQPPGAVSVMIEVVLEG